LFLFGIELLRVLRLLLPRRTIPMETIRDTAFGKLVRLFTHFRYMQYPEEQDLTVWTEYLKTENLPKEGEPATPVNNDENPEDLEAFGLYTVMSQASRRMSCASTLRESGRPLVISWRGSDDPEVSFVSIPKQPSRTRS
jgi:DHA1 family multidrug resistance protein-like MFS transporter